MPRDWKERHIERNHIKQDEPFEHSDGSYSLTPEYDHFGR